MSIYYYILRKIAALLVKLRLSSLFRINCDGFVLKFYPSHCSKVLWLKQYKADMRYTEETHFFMSYLRVGDVVIDVGANIGYLTLLASTIVGDSGRVYAFEPNPRSYKYLCGNLLLNRTLNVTTFNFALGEEAKDAYLTSQERKDDHNFITNKQNGICVRMKRLDEIGINNKSFALLKIDVEGYEKFVLQGAERLLNKVNCIYLEASELATSRFGYKITELLDFLRSKGFVIHTSSGANLIVVSNLKFFLDRIAH